MRRAIVIFLCVVSIWAIPFKESLRTFIPFNDLGLRIINGEKAEKGQFPWQVAIYINLSETINLCGGALISDSWILTAGHCVQDSLGFTIALGSNTLSGDDSDRVVMSTTDYMQHEEYNRFTLANDVALIPLPQAVQLNDYIQPINLASSQIDANSIVTVSGWGLTSNGGSSASNDLNYVDLVTISDSDCSEAYGFNINEGVICAEGDGDVVHSTCEGDSGGPLVEDVSTNPVHVGVVSFGHSDGCESGKPAGFARTDFYRDWIREKSGV